MFYIKSSVMITDYSSCYSRNIDDRKKWTEWIL